jgi:hypothetical protein
MVSVTQGVTAPCTIRRPSDEGRGLLFRRCLVSSLQWVVMPFRGMSSPQAWIFEGVLTIWVPKVLSYRARHSMSPLPEDMHPAVPTWYWKLSSAALGSPSMSQAGLRGWAVTGVPQYTGYTTPTCIFSI